MTETTETFTTPDNKRVNRLNRFDGKELVYQCETDFSGLNKTEIFYKDDRVERVVTSFADIKESEVIFYPNGKPKRITSWMYQVQNNRDICLTTVSHFDENGYISQENFWDGRKCPEIFTAQLLTKCHNLAVFVKNMWQKTR